jgi:hypothetical protein
MLTNTAARPRSFSSRLTAALSGCVLAVGLCGCGTEVVTDAPVSAEETQELDEQLQLIEKQLAKEADRRRPQS